MKRSIILLITFCSLSQLSFSQSDSTRTNTPQEEITVNKQFDENGNLIGYDSTYVYSWSSDSTNNSFSTKQLQHFFGFSDDVFITDSLSSFGNFHFQDKNIQQLLENFSGMFDMDSMDDIFSFHSDSLVPFTKDSTLNKQFQFKNHPFFQRFLEENGDSITSRRFPQNQFLLQQDSIWKKQQKMLQKHFKEMEKMHQEFFNF